MNGARRLRFRTLQKAHIGSVDPVALKIPARRAEYSLAESAPSPFHTRQNSELTLSSFQSLETLMVSAKSDNRSFK